MWEDPIVEDVHRTREKLAAEYDFDIKAIFADLRNRQAALGCRLVRQKNQPNQAPQPTGAATPVSQDPNALEAAPAAELSGEPLHLMSGGRGGSSPHPPKADA